MFSDQFQDLSSIVSYLMLSCVLIDYSQLSLYIFITEYSVIFTISPLDMSAVFKEILVFMKVCTFPWLPLY